MAESSVSLYANARIPAKCAACGIAFQALVRQIRIGRGKYCSFRCNGKVNGNDGSKQFGEANPSWRGGVYIDPVKRKQRRRELGRKYRAANPEREEVYKAVRAAVRKGEITPQPCIKCGGKAEGHHEDYSKPLDLTWLCKTHHRQRHVQIRQEARKASS